MIKRKHNNAMKKFVQSRIGFPCPLCGDKMVTTRNHKSKATIEHVNPLDNGGCNSMTNLEVICLACNRARNSVKQYFEVNGEIVPVEYWQCSLKSSLIYIVDCFYKQYHDFFLKARFG